MFRETEDITKAVVLAPGQAVLFFGRWSQGEGLSYEEVQDPVFSLSGDLAWIGRPTVVEVTTPYFSEGHRVVAQATVKNHGEARDQHHPHLHHVTHQPFQLARGHNVWCSKQEERTSILGGPSQRNDCGSPNVHDRSHWWHGARRVRQALSLGSPSPSPSPDRGFNSDHDSSVLQRHYHFEHFP